MSHSKFKLKICGMRDKSNILAVADAGPDYMGFIFFRGSRRFVGDDFQMPPVPSRIRRTGVFVDQSSQEILDLARVHGLELAQLHGQESPLQCLELQQSGLQVIKTFSIGSQFDFSVLEPYRSSVDFFLFDTAGREAGGNGIHFDWRLLEQYDQSVPFFLAGGLSPESKWESHLRGMNLHALDVNSGVEDAPGMKNIERVKKMCNIRNQGL
jgi:phosphoribosylanthranilate isomerase